MIRIFKILLGVTSIFLICSCIQSHKIQEIEIGNTLAQNITSSELSELKTYISKVLSLESGSLVKLADFDCGGGAGCYDLGDVIVQLLDSIGEKNIINLLNGENQEVYEKVLGLLSVGLEYGSVSHQSNEVEDVYPYIYHYLQANIRLGILDENKPQKDICESASYQYLIKDDSTESFIISVIDKNNELTYDIVEENMRPEMGFMDWCTDKYIVINSPCGGPCYGIRIIFIDQNRVSESFQYCKQVPNTDIIVYRKNEVFDTIYIRNILNEMEIMVKLDNCVPSPNGYKRLCSIDELEYDDDYVRISYHSIDPYIEPQMIDVSTIMK
jgi:hypothetical protein